VSQAPNTQIVGVFHDRAALESAIDQLQSQGIERSQLAVLGSSDAIRERLGLEVESPRNGDDPAGTTPIDDSDKRNLTPLLAGVPAYVAATLAAGVAIASGGTLAGAAVAALLGGAGGGALGAGAAGLFRDAVDEQYAEQLAHGGILLLVHPRSDQNVENARAVLEQHAAQEIETPPDRSMV
jgi:hypothetical protein